MELKYCLYRYVNLACLRSNRTFMELKFSTLMEGISVGLGSNRTFMELKLGV